MLLVRVFMSNFSYRRSRGPLNFLLSFRFSARGGRAFGARRKNLLTAVQTRHFVEAVREAEITALFVLDNSDCRKRVMRPAIAGVTPRVAHAD